MVSIEFQTLEARHSMPHDITYEKWFITRRSFLHSLPPIRREVYKAQDGSVIAFRDSGVGIDKALYMDQDFFEFYNGEPELDTILSDQGITNKYKVKLFRMEES